MSTLLDYFLPIPKMISLGCTKIVPGGGAGELFFQKNYEKHFFCIIFALLNKKKL